VALGRPIATVTKTLAAKFDKLTMVQQLPIAKLDISLRIEILSIPLAFDPSLWGPRRNIVIRYGTQKLEWFGYCTGNKV